MVVKPPPSSNETDSKAIDQFINKGGKTKSDNENKDEWTLISLRLPKTLLDSVDAKRSKQIGLSRNAWILQMIQKGLQD